MKTGLTKKQKRLVQLQTDTPYSKERKQAASDLAKKNIENLRKNTN